MLWKLGLKCVYSSGEGLGEFSDFQKPPLVIQRMYLFDNGPLGRWPHRFTFVEVMGCGFTLVGFILSVVVVFIFSRFFL